MARKKDEDGKSEKKGRGATPSHAVEAKPRRGRPPRAAGAATPARARATSKSSLEAVRIPVMETARKASEGSDKAKKKAKKALKAAKSRAGSFMPDLHMPAMPGMVGDAFKSIGTQIAGALNTDVGRVMMAELLVYVAKSLTKAATETEAAGASAKAAVVSTGAKVGAAAAGAGAKMVESGHSAAEAGSKMLDEGKAAASDAVGGARGLIREVAQVAVEAVGGVVVDAAKKAVSRRTKKPAAAEGAPQGSASPKQGSASPKQGSAPKVGRPASARGSRPRKPAAAASPATADA